MSELEAMIKTLRYAGYDVIKHMDQWRFAVRHDELSVLLAKYTCNCPASDMPIGAPPLNAESHDQACRYVAALAELEARLSRAYKAALDAAGGQE